MKNTVLNYLTGGWSTEMSEDYSWRTQIGASEDYCRNHTVPNGHLVSPHDQVYERLVSLSRTTRIRWYPNDSFENYDPKGNSYSIEDVDYDLNHYGFRCDEFDAINSSTNKKLMVLGCSNTFGIGLPESEVWPSLLANMLSEHINQKIDIINLSVPGGSSDDAMRNIVMSGDKFKPDYICMLSPPTFRKFVIDSNTLSYNYLPSNEYSVKYHKKAWKVAHDYCTNLTLDAPENYLYADFLLGRLVETYANLLNAKFKILSYDIFLKCDRDIATHKARDKAHHGKPTHEFLANNFFKGLVDE